MLGYLIVGVAIGPHALAWIPDTAEARAAGRDRRGVPDVQHRAGVQPAQARHDAPHRVRPGRAQVRRHLADRVGDRRRARRRVAGGADPGRRAGDVFHRDSRQDARGAPRAQLAARPADHRHPAVPGSRGGAAADPDPGARGRHGRPRGQPGPGARQGGGGAGDAAVPRPAADARLVSPRREAEIHRSSSCSTCC